MTDAAPIFDGHETPGRKLNADPSAMVVRGGWFYPATLLGPLAVFAAGYAFITDSPLTLLAFGLVGSMTGVVMTMIAMAWGVAIAFTDSTAAGLWFVLFPPYMPYFAATRWRWMAQPSVLFLTGLALAVATLWTVKLLTPAP
jgi:hypothetical protein